MKKERITLRVFLLVSMLVSLCAISGCKKTDKNDDLSNLEVVRTEANWIIPPSLDFLEQDSQALIIGKVVEREEPDSTKAGEDHRTYYKVKVKKVLNGTLENNESEIRVHQMWWLSKSEDGVERVYTMSNMKALKVGDTWLFFVKYGASLDAYQIFGDQNGCWPLADPKLVKLLETKMTLPTEEVAAYWRSYDNDFKLPIYYEILEKYGDQIKP
ncbi:MAG: hypothetical protein IKS10_02040 [Lachnospiraceae bacterium]|nr:hypothetical protein [Lachnospiraceae bacterium]